MSGKADHAVEGLVNNFLTFYPDEVARLVEERSAQEAVRFFHTLPPSSGATVFEKLTPSFAEQLLPEMEDADTVALLAEINPTRAAALLARMDAGARNRRLNLLKPSLGKELKQLLSYPPQTAGSLMDPRVTTFRPQATVREALSRLRGLRGRRIQDVFLVNPEGQLAGSVALQELAVATTGERLEALSRGVPIHVQAIASREEVVELLEHHRLASLPVVDFEGKLLGVLRSDALLAAAQEEVSADIQTMVGASREERALSRVHFAVRKRLPWLVVNLGTAFLAALVVGLFEGTIARFTALAVLLPVVAGQSGNTGAQALAVTMRGLVLREIRVRQWLRVALKEIGVGLLNGVVVALMTSLAVYAWSRSAGLALVIGLSMILSMVAASLAGAGVPMVLTTLGQDPAQSSSIVLTTITDVVGFLSFLGIATLLASML